MDLSHKFEDSPKLFGLFCKSVTGRARPRVVAGPWNVRGNSELFIVYRTHIKSTKKERIVIFLEVFILMHFIKLA